MTAPKFREGQQIAIGTLHGQVLRLRRWIVIVAVFAALGMIAGAGGMISGQRTVQQIQREREVAIRVNCEDVNRRHDRTIRQLDALLAVRLRGASARERERLRASRQTTVLLIEALTPKRECVALARALVRTGP